jgi:hypothetical protein
VGEHFTLELSDQVISGSRKNVSPLPNINRRVLQNLFGQRVYRVTNDTIVNSVAGVGKYFVPQNDWNQDSPENPSA